MKILLVHNDYGAYSGEEAVVDKMDVMFRSLGYSVAQLRMSTAGLRDSAVGKIKGFVSGVYSPSGVRAMRDAIRRERPDIINIHNLYPFISPAALFEARKAGIPVVMTIHNFRLMCPTGLFMRDGRPCELCRERHNEWGCVRYNCEASPLKSLGYALRNAVARISGAYARCVNAFACITDFQRRKLTEYGFDPESMWLIPNSVEAGDSPVWSDGDYIGFCGRISHEKGVDLIVETARRNPDIPFRLAGDVRDKDLVAELPTNVSLDGYLSGNALADFYRNARFMVMASRCYEGFPMSILEAAKYGKPTVGPDHGGFSEIIGKGSSGCGILFPPADIDALSDACTALWNDVGRVRGLGASARLKLETRYSADVVAEQWRQLLRQLAR